MIVRSERPANNQSGHHCLIRYKQKKFTRILAKTISRLVPYALSNLHCTNSDKIYWAHDSAALGNRGKVSNAKVKPGTRRGLIGFQGTIRMLHPQSTYYADYTEETKANLRRNHSKLEAPPRPPPPQSPLIGQFGNFKIKC